MKLNIITVCTGQAYGPEYLDKMRSMLNRHLSLPFALHCVTDGQGAKGWNKIAPPAVFHSWWDKLWIYSGIMPAGPLLYLDLDQVILGDITDIVTECLKRPVSCYADHIEWLGVKLGTAFLTFESESLQHVFDAFQADKEGVMERFANGGDQVYVGHQLDPASIWYFNEHFPPGTVQSYKFDYLARGLDPMTRILNLHGRPKQADIPDDPVIKEHWR